MRRRHREPSVAEGQYGLYSISIEDGVVSALGDGSDSGWIPSELVP
jgi:hypothetical protein